MRLQNIYSYFQCICAATILIINYSNAQNEEPDDLEIKRSKSVEWIGSCETDEIIKAETYGLSALSLLEKVKYYYDTRRCKYKEESKKIHKDIDNDQLEKNAERSKKFTGKASSCAYCALSIMFYLILNK